MPLIRDLFIKRKKQHNSKESEQKNILKLDDRKTNEEDVVAEPEHLNSNNTSEVSGEDKEIIYEVVEREILPAKIICPDCGGITLEGLEFCDKCGGELL